MAQPAQAIGLGHRFVPAQALACMIDAVPVTNRLNAPAEKK